MAAAMENPESRYRQIQRETPERKTRTRGSARTLKRPRTRRQRPDMQQRALQERGASTRQRDEREEKSNDEGDGSPTGRQILEALLQTAAASLIAMLAEVAENRARNDYFYVQLSCHNPISRELVKQFHAGEGFRRHHDISLANDDEADEFIAEQIGKTLWADHRVWFEYYDESYNGISSQCDEACTIGIEMTWKCLCRVLNGADAECEGCDKEDEGVKPRQK